MKKTFLFLCYNIVFTTNAYAYLDPGTGSIIIQGLIAAGLSVTLFTKAYWYKITTFFKKKSDQEDK